MLLEMDSRSQGSRERLFKNAKMWGICYVSHQVSPPRILALAALPRAWGAQGAQGKEVKVAISRIVGRVMSCFL